MERQTPRAKVSDLLRADLPDSACREMRCIQRALNVIHAHMDNLRALGLTVTPYSGGPHNSPSALGVKAYLPGNTEAEIGPYVRFPGGFVEVLEK